MSAENDSDDSECEYFLTPNVHQYNITEKIKQANSVLFSNDEASQRKHSPKVKFRDHKLVDFESDAESMEIQSNVVEDEVSDDGYSEEIVHESIETEEVSEQQQLETEVIEEKEHVEEENYEKETFHEETEEKLVENCEKPEEPAEKPEKKSTVFRVKSSKINPLETERRKKSCCDYKNADEYKEKLPKYGGHNSTYVSKDVFARQTGEFRYKKMQCKQEKFEQQLEQKKLLAETNEEAFSKWLDKKMRDTLNFNKSNPINYFDVKVSQKRRVKKRPTLQIESDDDEQI